MNLFERYLTVWVGLGIVVGIALGQAMPAFVERLEQTLAVPAAQLTVAARQGKRLQRQDGLPAARGGGRMRKP